MCLDLPLWHNALTALGAVSLASIIVLLALSYFLRPKRNTFYGKITRRLFG